MAKHFLFLFFIVLAFGFIHASSQTATATATATVAANTFDFQYAGISFTSCIDYNRSHKIQKISLTLEIEMDIIGLGLQVVLILGTVLVFLLGYKWRFSWGEITGFLERQSQTVSDVHHIHIIDLDTYYSTLFTPFSNNLLTSCDSQAIDVTVDDDDLVVDDFDEATTVDDMVAVHEDFDEATTIDDMAAVDDDDDDGVVLGSIHDDFDETSEQLQTENDAAHSLPYKKFTGYMPSLSILIPALDASFGQETSTSQDTSIEMSISSYPCGDGEYEYDLTEKFVQEADPQTFFSEVYRRWKPSEIDANIHNILSLYKASCVPIVPQKQAAAVWPGRRDIKMKALEAAREAKCREQEKEKERKTKKELFRAVIERSKKADMAAKKKQKEDDDAQQKRATTAAGRRDLNVKALEAAKAAKHREQEKEKERKKKKEAFRIELERVKKEHARCLKLHEKKMKEEMKKKQREEDERKQMAKKERLFISDEMRWIAQNKLKLNRR